jgi:hypothetical protein
MAAVLGAMLEAKPAQQIMRALAENAPPDDAGAGGQPQALEQGKGCADPSEAEYQKLYEYNLGLTEDRAKVEAERSPDSPLQALVRGQSVKIDPVQLQAVLALGMASAHRKPAPAPAKAAGTPASPRALRYMFWIVIALSAGAIAATTLALR